MNNMPCKKLMASVNIVNTYLRDNNTEQQINQIENKDSTYI